jgi:hypothetical protein
MQALDSRAVSVSLESYVRDRLTESDFFSGLAAGEVPPGPVRDVFGQYYRWRRRFHRWLGVCVAKSAALDDAPSGQRALGALVTGLAQEVNGRRRGLATAFLAALGIDDPARIAALPVTDAYAESFLRCYFPADRTGDEALAALAGRELAVPLRNSIIVSALREHYGITSGLELFRPPPADLAAPHFQVLWEALTIDSEADAEKLIEVARLEIWEHVTFWDDVYSTVLADAQLTAAEQVMTGSG